MKFLEMLKNLFKGNNQYEGISQTLACLNDIVPMPKRTDFHNNQSKLDEIDSYKAEYLKLLKQNKTITSIDLMPEYLHEFKNIYTDLLLNLCTEDNTSISFDFIEETGDPNIEHLNIVITCIKLMLYQQEVATLEEKTRIRLVALNEILENILNGKLFTKIKSKELINSLLYEISNLHSSLIVFLNQKHAMKMESESYLKNIGTLEGEAKAELIYAKLNEVKNMLKLIDEKELNRLESMDLNPRLFIAIIEQKLEIYVYTHPEMLEELKIKVRQLDYEVSRKVNYDFEDENNPKFFPNKNDVRKRKYELLEQIKELELLYKVFSKYGRNLVIKDDLETLYETKFKILTFDILEVDEIDILSNTTFTELECYQEIIFKKIETILKGENPNVNCFIPGGTINCDKSLTDIIGYITKALKDGENEFSPYKILQDKKLLSLLLAFDEENGIKYFFRSNYVSLSRYDYHLNLYKEIFKWNDNVSLETLYKIMRANIKTNKVKLDLAYFIDKCEPLYYLFDLYDEYKGYLSEDKYYLPKGITEIYFDSYFGQNIMKKPHIKRNDGVEELVVYIRKRAGKKPFVMPKTMKSIRGKLFDYINIETLILNEELETLGADFGQKAKSVYLPSSLVCYPFYIDFSRLSQIFIRLNNDNISLTFENLVRREDLLPCFKLDDKVPSSFKFSHKETMEKYLNKEIGSKVIVRYKIVPTFTTLGFIKPNGEQIIINSDDLIFTTEREEVIGEAPFIINPNYLELTVEELKMITKKLREIYCEITNQEYIAYSNSPIQCTHNGYTKKRIVK